MMAVRGILAGYHTKDAAYFADVDRRTVQLWVARFDEGGIGGLRDGSVTLSCASNWGLPRPNELGVNFGHAPTRYVDVRRGVPVSFVECHYKALRVAS